MGLVGVGGSAMKVKDRDKIEEMEMRLRLRLSRSKRFLLPSTVSLCQADSLLEEKISSHPRTNQNEITYQGAETVSSTHPTLSYSLPP